MAIARALGVDIGGTGMKAALVDIANGVLVTDRFRLKTPRPAVPVSMSKTFDELLANFEHQAHIGVAFPGVVRLSRFVATAANVDESWIGIDATVLFGRPGAAVAAINDADAAGLAEMRFGAGRGISGVVIVVTVGTGLGTAVFVDGKLVPNTELGHIEVDGADAESAASARVVKVHGLSMREWASRFSRYLQQLETILWPDLIIVGGGFSKRFDAFAPCLDNRVEVVPAQLKNNAGIIGAAMHVSG